MTDATRPLRVALVGAGYFSRFHVEGWLASEGVQLVGICDQDAARAAQVAESVGAAGFNDLETMLDTVKPDLLDIATPPAGRKAIVAAACARGIKMVCQKPVAPTFEETAEIVAMAEAAGVTLVVHENFRFMPWYREVARLIANQRMGKIYSLTFHLRPGDGRGENAYLDRQPYFQQMERLLIHETAVHFIDTFRYLLGDIQSVYASLRRLNPVIRGEDAGVVIFEFTSGAQAVFDGNRLAEHVTDNPRRTMGEMVLEAEAGRLRLDGQGRLWMKPFGEAEYEHEYAKGPDNTFGGGAATYLQQHVARHFQQGGPLENTGRDYLIVPAIEEAIYRSHAEGRRIDCMEFGPVG